MTRPRLCNWLAGGSVCLATLLVWLPTIHFGFVYDDRGQILDNPQLRSWAYFAQYFREHAWAHLAWMPASFYRPLFLVWLRLNYVLFGADPRGWHLASVLLHGLATALVFHLALALFRDSKAASIAALIFGLHPAHAENVAWISGGTDVLATVLVLASFGCFLRSHNNSRGGLWLSVAFYSTALLVKEVAIVGVAAVMLWMVLDGEDLRTPRFAARAGPFLGVTFLYLLIRKAVVGKIVASASAISLGQTLRTIPSLAFFYAKHLLWPTRLSGFYDCSLVQSAGLRNFVLPMTVLVAGIALLVAFGYQLRGTKYEAAFYLALLLLAMPLLPAFYLRGLEPGNFAHDRYLYLPVAGFAFLIAIAYHRVSQESPRLAATALVLFCGMGLSYALSSLREAQIWKDGMSLFTRAAEVAPENMVAKVNLATELIRQQRCRDAVPLLQEVIRRRPEMWFAHANLANCYVEAGQESQAERELSLAVELQPLPELVERLQMLRARH